MLKARILTIAIILPAFVAALFLLDSFWFGIIIAILLVLGLAEWTQFSQIGSRQAKIVYIGLGLGLLILLQFSGLVGAEFFFLVTLLWGIVVIRLRYYAASDNTESLHQSGISLRASVDGYFVLLPTWLGLHLLHQQDAVSPQLLLVFFCIIWAADTGAYLVGRTWGRRKLAPAISPGKTVEGLLGGLAGAVLVAAVAAILLWDLSAEKLLLWLLAAAVVALFSVVGDLFESIYKRSVGLKDSGTLLPGHGGVLDRIDSVCAALPVYIITSYGLGLLQGGSTGL